ncbi:MAG: cytochrome c-type biogenesis CcmF C-terminal domain-containing protein [Baekduia sp.]
MPSLGSGLLILALASSAFGVLAALRGATGERPGWVTSSRRASYVVAGLATGAFVIVELAFLRTDLSFAIVQSHSSTTTPLFYRATAMWSSQEGSLLLWLWLLTLWTALVLWRTQRRMRDVQPWATAVLLAFATFFSALLVFKVSPFAVLNPAASEGAGLNPLLRYPSMMTHPPMLYAGYTLWAVPFAFAVGALIVRRTGAEWLVITRSFALGAWLCLGIGILLGARWSYAELGWGGYWAWDPVENASLLPWLTGTAFIHSAMVQEKRGMLKTWNASLILATGTLAILGTFLVRSGVIQSIHAFTGSDLGWPFLILIVVMIGCSVWLVVSRRASLKTEHRLDSLLSRESMFLANNLVLVAMAFVVFWGTFFPLISEALTGTEQTLGPTWYGRYIAPLALVLVALTAVGPLVPWRRSSWRLLRRPLLITAVAGLLAAIGTVLLGAGDRPLAVLFFAASGAAIATVVLEFARGAKARRAIAGEGPLRGTLSLLRRNNRRYGGYLVHLGIVVLLVGVAASSAFQDVVDVRIQPGQVKEIGAGYSVRYDKRTTAVKTQGEEIEKLSFGAAVTLLRDGEVVARLHPEREYYPLAGAGPDKPLSRWFAGESTSEIAMRTSPIRDVWIAMTPDTTRLLRAVEQGDPKLAALQGSDEYPRLLGVTIGALARSYVDNAPPATFRMIVSPLVRWVWIGGLLTFLGALVCLVPTGRPRDRTERARYVAKVASEVSG